MSDFTELFGEEIVVLVFSFLPVADLHRAARVSHTWMRIALDQQLWKLRCKRGGRKSVMEHMVAYYKSKKLSVPWREIYSVLYHQHQFSTTDKSEDVRLSEDDTVATAQSYLNVTVKTTERMVPSGRQPFHYYQVLVVEKKYTHMSIGITDRDWGYSGNLVGFGQNCYNYAFHSNGLILHHSNSEVDKVPMYGTGDSVGLLVQYEDKTKRPSSTAPDGSAVVLSNKSGPTLCACSSGSSAGETSDGAMTVEAGSEMHQIGYDTGGGGEVDGGETEGRMSDYGDEEEEENEAEEAKEDGINEGDALGVRIRRTLTPLAIIARKMRARANQPSADSTSGEDSAASQAMTKRRKGHKLVLYLFLNGRWCYTWKDTQPPPYGEIAFTVALNGTGACVALNKEEDAAHRAKRRVSAIDLPKHGAEI